MDFKEFWRNWFSLIKAPLQVLPERTEGNHENLSAWPVSQPKPEHVHF
jgi:hypothetical protein